MTVRGGLAWNVHTQQESSRQMDMRTEGTLKEEETMRAGWSS